MVLDETWALNIGTWKNLVGKGRKYSTRVPVRGVLSVVCLESLKAWLRPERADHGYRCRFGWSILGPPACDRVSSYDIDVTQNIGFEWAVGRVGIYMFSHSLGHHDVQFEPSTWHKKGWRLLHKRVNGLGHNVIDRSHLGALSPSSLLFSKISFPDAFSVWH